MNDWEFDGEFWTSTTSNKLFMVEEWDAARCKHIANLETELAQLKKDCAPFQAQIDQSKTYKTWDEIEERRQDDGIR